ncbi:hypothetical protein [Mesorhizobium sp. M00.F.Ca.ET.216.01.1.1]|uniref:hypothetical protein n=1 Tax=Mesorhizobium sp. M00.F.Ca.ET.216.01.1.1 TaxID=2500528 RepID=UPI0016720945|nr:hypothetical protein [Mesorhizobium sp. M00.F.Ca.ET.216.01.1.1]
MAEVIGGQIEPAEARIRVVVDYRPDARPVFPTLSNRFLHACPPKAAAGILFR